MPKYLIEVRRQGGGWGWLLFAFLMGCGIAAVAHNHPAKPPPQQFEDPFKTDIPLPDDGGGPPSLTPTPSDEIPDTAKPEPVNSTRPPVISI